MIDERQYFRRASINWGIYEATRSFVAAMVFDRLFYLMRYHKSENDEYVDEDGRPWCYASVRGLHRAFDCLISTAGIHKALALLIDQDFIIKRDGRSATRPFEYALSPRMEEILILEYTPADGDKMAPGWFRQGVN